jgi:hypothetical protein
MGYGTHACAIDIDRLRSVFGSNDRAMLKALDESYGDTFLRNDEWSADRISEGAPTQREALAQIIEGKITGPDWAGFQYGYATEILCEHLGHWLEDENLIHDIEDLEIPTGLSNYNGLLFPVPEPDDFPDIRFLTAEQVREDYERLTGLDLSHEDEELEAAREEFRSYFRQASEKGLGLVTFAY